MFEKVRFIFDGTPCEVKAACTVWSGGKSGDDFKGLPITIRLEIAGHEALDAELVVMIYERKSAIQTGWRGAKEKAAAQAKNLRRSLFYIWFIQRFLTAVWRQG